MKYVIEKKTFDRHIDDEVHLYGLLHQLAFQAGKVKDDEDMETVLETAMRYGEIADETFARWEIPGRYLVFGDKRDLANLYGKELTRLTQVLAEHDTEKLEQAVQGASWDDVFVISGGSVRLFVGNIFELVARYGCLCRRIEEVQTAKDLERLKKQASVSERVLRRMFRGWGIENENGVTCHEVLQKAIEKKHLIPVPDEEPDEELSVEDFFEDDPPDDDQYD